MKKALLLAALLLPTACATTRVVPAPLQPAPPAAPAELSAPTDAPGPALSLFPELKSDAVHIATAPFHWEGSDWAKFGLGVAAVGGAVLLDQDLKNVMDRNSGGSARSIANAVAPFGSEYSFGVLGAFFLSGKLLKNEKAMSVAEDGLASSLIAAGVISPILKLTVSRERPNRAESTFDRDRGGMSFPSGHATQAFAVASVIAAHYDSPWVKVAAYGLAGLVGLARMEQGEHFASDVLAGALIGTAVGNAVVRFHDSERLHISFAPSMNPRAHGAALMLSLR
jgi:hypothetical protein